MKAENIHFLLLLIEERLMSTYHEGEERKMFRLNYIQRVHSV